VDLSWDLHLHPGPSSVPRWGDGMRVWEAALRAGVRGFVWKSHEEHTVTRCRQLPAGPPTAIPSASLNPWTNVEEVMAAVEAGARWLWGPSRDAEGGLGWELPLPSWWPELRERLAGVEHPLVLATSHLSPEGRRELASAALELPNARCSVTHSLYVPPTEAQELAELQCAFEFDLYTNRFPREDRPAADLIEAAASLHERGALAYLTSDGGQEHTGNPFDFASRELDELAERAGRELIEVLARRNPDSLVQHVLPLEGAASRSSAVEVPP
jgi:hypothetical protein